MMKQKKRAKKNTTPQNSGEPVEPQVLLKGIVTRSTGSWYMVRENDGKIWECRIVGKFRLDNMILTNPVAVGDEVQFFAEVEEENKGIINLISPRRNYVARQSPRQSHHLHLLASNINQAVVIVTVIEPHLKPGFIDRFLLMTEPQDIPAIIIFNKSDLYGETEMAMYHQMREVYTSIGYEVMLVTAKDRTGLEALKETLQHKTTLVCGQSGVGKSTLVNAIQPQLQLRTFEISDSSGKGQHTTTFAEMFELDFGGAIIDTPGIKTLSFNNLEPMQVTHNFREMFRLSHDCKFGSACTHRSEPQCAVLAALEAGTVSELRYMNYLQIREEVEEQNYWERHKSM